MAAAALMVLVTSMTIAIWEWFDVPEAVPKALAEIVSVAAIAACVGLRPGSTRAFLYLAPIVLIAAIGSVTAVMFGDGVRAAVLFARDMLKSTVWLVVAFAFMRGRTIGLLAAALAFLTIVQVPVAMLKLNFIGIDEKFWIGTMHQSAGQLGVLLPLLMVPIFVVLGLVTRSSFTWFLLFFSFFAIVHEKRLAVFAIPMLAIGVWVMFILQDILLRRQRPRLSSAQTRAGTAVAILAVSAATIHFGIFSIPSLNPTGLYAGGVLDVRYLFSYVVEYLFRGYVSPLNNPLENLAADTGIQLGRFELIKEAMVRNSEQPLAVSAFGFGGSNTSPSYLLGEDRDDILFKRHGLRGATPMAVRLLFDTGYVGLTLFVGWFVLIGTLLVRRMSDADPRIAILAAIATSWHAVAAFDSFIYSTAFWTYGILAPAYFLLLGVMLMPRSKLASLLPDALGVMGLEWPKEYKPSEQAKSGAVDAQ